MRAKIDRLYRFLPWGWLDSYSQEEIDQQLLIEEWKNPGLPSKVAAAAVRSLMWQSYREARKLRGWSKVDLDINKIEIRYTSNIQELTCMENLISSSGFSWFCYLLLISENKKILLQLLEVCPSDFSRKLNLFKYSKSIPDLM